MPHFWLEVFKVKLDRALRNPIWWHVSIAVAGVLELDDLLNPFQHKSRFSNTNGIVKRFITQLLIVIRSRHSHYINLIKYFSSAPDYFSSKGRRRERCRRQGYSNMQTCFFGYHRYYRKGTHKISESADSRQPSPILLCRHPAQHKENLLGAKVSKKTNSIGWHPVGSQFYLTAPELKISLRGAPDFHLLAPKELKLLFTRRWRPPTWSFCWVF